MTLAMRLRGSLGRLQAFHAQDMASRPPWADVRTPPARGLVVYAGLVVLDCATTWLLLTLHPGNSREINPLLAGMPWPELLLWRIVGLAAVCILYAHLLKRWDVAAAERGITIPAVILAVVVLGNTAGLVLLGVV